MGWRKWEILFSLHMTAVSEVAMQSPLAWPAMLPLGLIAAPCGVHWPSLVCGVQDGQCTRWAPVPSAEMHATHSASMEAVCPGHSPSWGHMQHASQAGQRTGLWTGHASLVQPTEPDEFDTPAFETWTIQHKNHVLRCHLDFSARHPLIAVGTAGRQQP